MGGEGGGDGRGKGVFVAAPEVAPEVAAVVFFAVVVNPGTDECRLFVGSFVAVEGFEVGLHQFERSEPQVLLDVFAHGKPLSQLAQGFGGGQGRKAEQGVVGVVDESCAARARRVPGEVLEPVTRVVFGLGAAGAEARPGRAVRWQQRGEAGVFGEG